MINLHRSSNNEVSRGVELDVLVGSYASTKKEYRMFEEVSDYCIQNDLLFG